MLDRTQHTGRIPVSGVHQLDCLVIQQPYASLIAYGRKRWEFRSYDCKRRGIIGIAASPGSTLRTLSTELNSIAGSFPRGMVLALADLVNSSAVIGADLERHLSHDVNVTLHGHEVTTIDEPIGEPRLDVEKAIGSGFWRSFAWQFENVRSLKKPIPFHRTSKTTWTSIEVNEEIWGLMYEHGQV
nr:hypothetical protein [Candidatus Njordarchaeota archaeon]